MSSAVIVIFILRLLLAALLFGFLAWAVYTIWRDLREQGQFISAPVIPTLALTRLDHGDTGQAAPVSFTEREVIVGRSTTSDFPVADETVSARHARFSYHHNHWWIEDYHSTNGTFLNDERVSVPTVIVSGDELRVGQVYLAIAIQDRGSS